MIIEVIPEDAPIIAGEIRVEAESLANVAVVRYSKNLDMNSAKVIGTFDLFDYIMLDKYHFLKDIKQCIVRAHLKPQNVRITTYVMDFFMFEENY